MSNNRINGAGKQGVGKSKEAVGKAVGDERLRAKGVAEKIAGSTQSSVGKAQIKLAKSSRK